MSLDYAPKVKSAIAKIVLSRLERYVNFQGVGMRVRILHAPSLTSTRVADSVIGSYRESAYFLDNVDKKDDGPILSRDASCDADGWSERTLLLPRCSRNAFDVDGTSYEMRVLFLSEAHGIFLQHNRADIPADVLVFFPLASHVAIENGEPVLVVSSVGYVYSSSANVEPPTARGKHGQPRALCFGSEQEWFAALRGHAELDHEAAATQVIAAAAIMPSDGEGSASDSAGKKRSAEPEDPTRPRRRRMMSAKILETLK